MVPVLPFYIAIARLVSPQALAFLLVLDLSRSSTVPSPQLLAIHPAPLHL